MARSFMRWISAIVSSLALGSLAACGGGGGGGPAAPSNLSYASPVTLTVGAAAAPLSPTVTGSVTTYSVSPALPAGLTLNATGGVVSGTPTTVTASRGYTVTASNSAGSTTFVLTIAVDPPAPSGLAYTSPVAALVGDPLAPLRPTVTGTVDSYAVSPALPAGLALDTATGIIGGTATAPAASRSYTITARNTFGSTTFDLRLSALALAADAGASQAVELGTFVTLDGSASTTSGGHPLVHDWTLSSMPAGSESALAATSSVRPVFRADRTGTYTATLRVRDGTLASSTASVDIQVLPKVDRVVTPPEPGSLPVSTCQEITVPGHYVLQADLTPGTAGAPCLSIRDATDVVLHCDGHRIADPADRSSPALEIRRAPGFTIRACRVNTVFWAISDSAGGSIVDSTIEAVAGVATQPVVSVSRSPRLAFEHNRVADVQLQLISSDDALVTDNQFRVTPAHRSVIAFHVGAIYSSNLQVLRNEFDGGWDGLKEIPALTNEVDDAISVRDVTGAVIRHNYMANYWDVGFEWSGRLANATIESNVVVNAGVGAIGGWYWSSVTGTRFAQNLGDRGTGLFEMYRLHGLRPANFDGPRPADNGVYFVDNTFDGNVQRNQRATAVSGATTQRSAYLPLFERMGYGGDLSNIPGERVPVAGEFFIANNVFVRNDFGKDRPGPYFGQAAAPALPGAVRDGGQNRCDPSPGTQFPLACQ